MSAAASLLDVAIRALVQSGAPRRTVAATIAAMTSVLLADERGGTGRGGAAAPPTAAQQRRTKRKQKAAKERAVLVPGLPCSGDGGDQDPGLGEGFTAEPTSAVASDLSLHPAAVMPQHRCLHCSQLFDSRIALRRHLRQSGHAESLSPSSFDGAHSDSGLSEGTMRFRFPQAANPLSLPGPPLPLDLERQPPQPPPWWQFSQQPLEQGGGPASSEAVLTVVRRVVDVPAPHGTAMHGRRRKGPSR